MHKVLSDSGASFVVWTVSWGPQYIPALIQALETLLAGRQTRRDLLRPLAERLHENGIRVIFSYHYGYDCYLSRDDEWMEAGGEYRPDKTQLFANVISIVSEIGHRYGLHAGLMEFGCFVLEHRW